MNKIFWVKESGQKNPKRGFIERIEYGKGKVELFDEAAGKIDLDVLKPHVGERIELYRNGELENTSIIASIEKNDDGIKTVYMDSIEAEVKKADNEI